MATTQQAIQNAQNMLNFGDVGSPAYMAARQLVQSANQGNQKAVVAQVAQQNAREAGSSAAFGNDVKQTLTDLQQQAKWLTDNGIPAEKVKELTTDTYTNTFKGTVENIKKEQGSGFGKLVNFALAAGQAMTLPGIGQGISQSLNVSKAVGTAIAAFGVGTAQGQNLETALKNSLAMLTASQVPEFLKNAGVVVDNAAAKAALNSGAEAATAAALTGRNPVEAGLAAALTAGVVETVSEKATESAGTGLKAPGQVAAPSAAGEASLRTDVAGTAPEVGTGTGIAASPTALLTQQLAPYTSQIGDVISGGGRTVQPRYTGAADIITPSSLSQYLPQYQAPESTSGSMKRGLSTGEREALSEALKLGFSSMLGGGGGGSQTTYAAGDTQRTTALPVGQYSPGSQALAQALRVGDIGAPIFGTDKDKGKKSGWNVESLRYMGDVGEA